VIELRSLIRRFRLKAWGALFAIPAGFALLFGILWALEAVVPRSSSDVPTIVMGTICVVALLLGLPICILIANDFFKRVGALKHDRRSPTVAVSSPLEVLVESRAIWSMNGKRFDRWMTVTHGVTAPAPEQAARAARYVRPVEMANGSHNLHQRSLSPGERAELAAASPSLRGRFLLSLILFNAFAIATIVAVIMRGPGVTFFGFLATAYAAWMDFQLWKWLRFRRMFKQDLAAGFVVISQKNEAAPIMEVLPQSGIQWMLAGVPSAWRRAQGRAPS
jgi:hypothetical protein